jgi:hypothetical protein
MWRGAHCFGLRMGMREALVDVELNIRCMAMCVDCHCRYPYCMVRRLGPGRSSSAAAAARPEHRSGEPAATLPGVALQVFGGKASAGWW